MPQHDHISMALFCDFENVALGVRDANDEKFDIRRVLERLLLKGTIVVKKAYCDWDRYKGFKAAMHEANFELIEIPHVRQSGKNSADIRMVVDALDLCYTKSHVNTFVIISGDSDFSPLVSKLRENAKHVIGVGVKQSTSDLLIANCDEFIYYDDLVRGSQRRTGTAGQGGRDAAPRRSPEEEKRRREEMDARRAKAVDMAAETYEALVTDRDDGGRIWASVLKEAIKRRNPGFNENYFGFRTFGNLLEEAHARGLLDFGRDEKSGTWVARGTGVPSTATRGRGDTAEALLPPDGALGDAGEASGLLHEPPGGVTDGRRLPEATALAASEPADEAAAHEAPLGEEGRARRRSRGGRGRNKGEARPEHRVEHRGEGRHPSRREERGVTEQPLQHDAPSTPDRTAAEPPQSPPAPGQAATARPALAASDAPAAVKKTARKSPARKATAKAASPTMAPDADIAGSAEPLQAQPARKKAQPAAKKARKAMPSAPDGEPG